MKNSRELRDIESTLDNCFTAIFCNIHKGMEKDDVIKLQNLYSEVSDTISERINEIESAELKSAELENEKRRERVNAFRELYYAIGRDAMGHGIKYEDLLAMNAKFDALMAPIEAGAERGRF